MAGKKGISSSSSLNRRYAVLRSPDEPGRPTGTDSKIRQFLPCQLPVPGE